MSLELAIQENTTALRELIRLLTPVAASTTAITMTAAEYVVSLDKIEAEAALTAKLNAEDAELKAAIRASKVESPKPADTPIVEETAVAPVETAVESPSDVAAIDYTKDVKPLLLKVSTSKGRDALVTLLAKFGVAKGDQLPADSLGNVLAEANELLAA